MHFLYYTSLCCRCSSPRHHLPYKVILDPFPLQSLLQIYFWYLFEEKFRAAESRLQVIQPDSLWIILCEERPVYEIGITSLNHTKHKHFLCFNFFHSRHLHLARPRRHTGPTDCTCQPAHLFPCASEDVPGSFKRYPVKVLRTGISHHEHVVRDHPQLHLLPPHLRPLI